MWLLTLVDRKVPSPRAMPTCPHWEIGANQAQGCDQRS
jgi:hypothetical protein